MKERTCSYPEDRILAYVAGDLAVEDELDVAEHLSDCGNCCNEAAEYMTLGQAIPEVCATDAIRWHGFSTPFGTMYVAATDRGLVRVSWKHSTDEGFVDELERRFPNRLFVHDRRALVQAEKQLREYFDGDRSSFDLPVDLSALSEFERRVLEAAQRIPFGEVLAYSDLARRIGRPRAARAVGNALGHNPVGIIVPCHRVVRRDGGLGGYTGGLEYKRRLLRIEGRADLAEAS